MQLFDIHTIVLFNFGIFKGKHVINCEGKDIIGVVAAYKEDKERSNRSGKSLVMEAVLYNLEGNSRAKTERSLIHHSNGVQEDVMYVEIVYIDQDKNKYKVKRGRDIKNNGLLELDWIEKTTEAQKAINELFGIDNDLDLTNFFKQSDIHGFMNLGPTSQKETLMKYLDNTHWKLKEKMAITDRDKLKSEIKENETVKKTLEASLEVSEDLEVTKREKEKQLKVVNKMISECEADIEKDKAVLAVTETKKASARKEMLSLKSESARLTGNQEKISENDKLVAEKKKLIKELEKDISESLEEDYETVGKEIIEIKSELTGLLMELKGLRENKGVCPVLKSSCESIAVSKADIENKEKLIEKKKKEVAKKEEYQEDLYTELQTKKKLDKAKNDLKVIQATVANIKEENIDQLLEQIQEKMDKCLGNMTQDNSDLKDELEVKEDKLNDLKDEQRGVTSIISSLEYRIGQSKKALTKITEIDEHNEGLREELEDLNYICLMLGKNGIPADEIENGFIDVENNINLVLDQLNCGLSLNFNADKEIDKMEPICSCGFQFPKGFRGGECPECSMTRMKQRRDEMSLRVIENGIEQDFSMDSGGGKTIISFAVRIALTMLKRQQGKCRLNMLFLDEVDGPLDPFFAEQIISSITKLLTKKLGFSQILLVSHKEAVKNAVPHVLKVTRYADRTSKIAFVE